MNNSIWRQLDEEHLKNKNKKLFFPQECSVPFIKNMTFHFVQLFPKQSTWFEIQAALFTSSVERKEIKHFFLYFKNTLILAHFLAHVSLTR